MSWDISLLPSDASVEEPCKHVDTVQLAEMARLEEDLWVTNGYRFPRSLCMVALLLHEAEPNAAARWLLDHGENFIDYKIAPLVKRIELEPSSTRTVLMYGL